MFRRIFMFFLVNILVVLTITTVLNLLGVRPYLTQFGLDYQSLAVFCLVWGMGGAFISLGLSKVMAKWMMRVEVIDPNTQEPRLRYLVQTVHNLALAAGLPKMPEVGVYQSPEVNAFATGPTKSSALVAVSSGLLHRMDNSEVEGVLGHEVAHIANGDMVTMTLIQGIINAFVMFFARVLAFAAAQFLRGNRDEESSPSPMLQYVFTILFEIVFSILGAIAVNYFSRTREFRADFGGARLAGRDKMIAALEGLRRGTQLIDDAQPAMATLKISGKKKSGFVALFASHPPLEERIARLKEFR